MWLQRLRRRNPPPGDANAPAACWGRVLRVLGLPSGHGVCHGGCSRQQQVGNHTLAWAHAGQHLYVYWVHWLGYTRSARCTKACTKLAAILSNTGVSHAANGPLAIW